jgi:hypothetical protein
MTAVEWLIQYLNNVKPNEFCSIETIKELLQQAKEMEKQQIMVAYVDGFKECEKIHEEAFFIQDLSDDYYLQTYKK